MGLITIADLELFLGKTITGGDDEALYTYLITAAQAEADRVTHRSLESASYTETYDGTGTDEIYLNNYPVTTMTKVEYGTPFDLTSNPRDEIEDTDYVLDDEIGSLTFLFNSAEKKQMFSIQFTAGYTALTCPDDLKVILMTMVEEQKVTTYGDPDLKKEKIGDYEYERFGSSSAENNKMVWQNSAARLAKYIRNDT